MLRNNCPKKCPAFPDGCWVARLPSRTKEDGRQYTVVHMVLYICRIHTISATANLIATIRVQMERWEEKEANIFTQSCTVFTSTHTNTKKEKWNCKQTDHFPILSTASALRQRSFLCGVPPAAGACHPLRWVGGFVWARAASPTSSELLLHTTHTV